MKSHENAHVNSGYIKKLEQTEENGDLEENDEDGYGQEEEEEN